MHYSNFILLGLLTAGACSSVLAQETPTNVTSENTSESNPVVVEQKTSTLQAIKDLQHPPNND